MQGMLCCFDPGLTTGVALFHEGVLTDTFTLPLAGSHFFLEYNLSQLVVARTTTIVIESFIGMRLTTEARLTLQLIGAIDYAAQVYLGHPPYFQRPQDRLSFLPDARLLVKGLPAQQKWLQHHYDSVAHGLKYMYDLHNDAAGETLHGPAHTRTLPS